MAAAEIRSRKPFSVCIADGCVRQTQGVFGAARVLADLAFFLTLSENRHIYGLGDSGPHSPLGMVFVLVAGVGVKQKRSCRDRLVALGEPEKHCIKIGDRNKH